MAILTEPSPRAPEPAAHPGAWRPGQPGINRGAEYGAPAMSGVLAWTPARAPAHVGEPGHDDPAPTLGDIIGHTPAIGVHRP